MNDGKKDKIFAYSQCGNTSVTKEECLCKAHFKMFQENNNNLKLYEKDIVQKSDTESSVRLATKKDSYFNNKSLNEAIRI